MFDPKSQHFYNSYDQNSENRNHRGKAKRSAKNYENYTSVNIGDIQFKASNIDEESEVCSPPLWKGSPSNFGNLSPNSRSKAIAKGQKELMEMARNMPESCYELSLRDMVQSHVVESSSKSNHNDDDDDDEEETCLVEEIKFEKRKSVKKRMERGRSASFESGGTLLKMMFPISMGSKRKKNNLSTNGTSKRVSSKVETLGKPSISEKDWWKKRFLGSSGSESSVVTNTSSGSCKSTSSYNSNNSRKSKGWSSGCWSFVLLSKFQRKSK